MSRTLGGLLCLALAASPTSQIVVGQPLGEALNLLEARGLSLIYSSEVVPPGLRVVHAPHAASAREVLEQLLAPHSLGVREGPGGRLLIVALPRAALPGPVEQAPPSFPAGVELVTVDAVVLDSKGEPFLGLRPEDFTVREDGVPQRITSFEAVATPQPAAPRAARRLRASSNESGGDLARRFVVVFDEVHMSPLQAERAKETLAAFLRKGLVEGDKVTIAPTGGSGWWNGTMTADGRDLAAFVRHLKGLRPAETSTCALGEYDAWLVHRQRDRTAESRLLRWLNECNPTLDPPVSQGEVITADGRIRPESLREARERRAQLDVAPGRGQLGAAAASVYERADARRRRTLESLTRVLEGLVPVRGRKVVLLVSEGFVDEPGLAEARAVARASLRASAAVFFLDARGSVSPVAHAAADAAFLPEGRDVTGFLDQQDHLDDGAESIALQTGGAALRGDLSESWARVAAESRAYYLLGYHSTNASRDGRLRKLDIEVARPGARVRARPGYYASAEGEAEGADDALRGALDLAASGGAMPLRLAAFVMAPSDQSRTRALLVAEAGTRGLGLRESEGRLAGQLDVLAVVVSRETGAVTPLSQRVEVNLPAGEPVPGWLAVPRELELQPGTYQARLVVRASNGRVAAVEHEFAVPPSGLRISTPVLNSALDGNGRPLPTARTRFAAQGQLHCRFEVHGSTRDPRSGTPRVSARHVLHRSDGSVVSESGFSPLAVEVDGTPARVLTLSLEDAAPGRYDLTLEARDDVSGQTRSVREPYVIEEKEKGAAP
ncbi:MAG TPA: VWA domain-containing protein [Vicinamibacteria bacterium]|nr:VWA domain-containing protein [Vicinamibacteria bacterium]